MKGSCASVVAILKSQFCLRHAVVQPEVLLHGSTGKTRNQYVSESICLCEKHLLCKFNGVVQMWTISDNYTITKEVLCMNYSINFLGRMANNLDLR